MSSEPTPPVSNSLATAEGCGTQIMDPPTQNFDCVVLGHQKYLNRELRKANDILELHTHGKQDDTMMEITSNAAIKQGTNDRISGEAITAAPDDQ